MPKNASSIISNDYSGKFTNALVNMMNGFTDKNPIVLNPVEKTPVASRVTGVTANISWNAVPLADGYYVEILSDKKGDNWHGAELSLTDTAARVLFMLIIFPIPAVFPLLIRMMRQPQLKELFRLI